MLLNQLAISLSGRDVDVEEWLYEYFRVHAAVKPDVETGIEVWVKASVQPEGKDFTRYLTFGMKAFPVTEELSDMGNVGDVFLRVSYCGAEWVYNRSIGTLNISTDDWLAMAGNEVVHNLQLSPEQKRELMHVYPVVNKEPTEPGSCHQEIWEYLNYFLEQYLRPAAESG
ncbi:MAG: hypothetical protein LUE99_12525 [Bacteroides sp.]|nr:hypothetical protein [Bacteroides sp.]